ncbi:MAG: ABC transporter permease [Candidatus Rokubacteria bacterium]|nr:ABC transporter permease [Candidatus Rokubacteria bacterium]
MALGALNVLMIVFMLAPLVLVVWMSFTPDEFFSLPLDTFSLRWYHEAFAYPGFVEAFVLSALLALAAATVAVTLGFLAAYALVRFQFPGRAALDAFFVSPLLVPAVVLGIALLQFVNRLGLYNTFAGLLAAHVVVVVPYTVRVIVTALRSVSEDLEWAAMNLGARRGTMLRRITLPLARRGMLAAFLFAFILSFDEVTVTIFMTGPAYQTLPIRVYNYLTDQVDPTVAAVSTLLILLSGVLVILLDRIVGLENLGR